MRFKSSSDFWCGLIFVAIGVAFLVYAQQYRLGVAAKMGPGYFPTLLGGLLIVLGGALSLPALWTGGERIPPFRLRPVAMVLASILAFAVTLEPLGFVLASALLVLLAGFADPSLRLRERAGLAVGLSVSASFIFVVVVRLPLNLWPNL